MGPESRATGPHMGPESRATVTCARTPRGDGRGNPRRAGYPYILRIANSTICSTAFASKTMRCSPSMSRTKP